MCGSAIYILRARELRCSFVKEGESILLKEGENPKFIVAEHQRKTMMRNSINNSLLRRWSRLSVLLAKILCLLSWCSFTQALLVPSSIAYFFRNSQFNVLNTDCGVGLFTEPDTVRAIPVVASFRLSSTGINLFLCLTCCCLILLYLISYVYRLSPWP